MPLFSKKLKGGLGMDEVFKELWNKSRKNPLEMIGYEVVENADS